MNRLVLIDGNAILHRAYHALPMLTNKKGKPTGAIYGFVSMMLRVINELQPSHLAVCFDRPGPTFRNELYEKYQEHRPDADKELTSQIIRVHDVVKAMGIPFYEVDGYEADDVLGTIAQQVQSKKIGEIVIVSGDKDLLQLVNKQVKLYLPAKGIKQGKVYDKKDTQERIGVTPSQVVDFKALAGDPSDNYPGVKGIGPKTAIGLLEKYGSVDNVYKNLDQIESKSVRERLETDKENAYLSQKLAQVVSDVPLDFNLEDAKLKDLLTREVIEVFGELGFKTLLKRLTKMSGGRNREIKKSEIERLNPTRNKDVKEQEKSEQIGLF